MKFEEAIKMPNLSEVEVNVLKIMHQEAGATPKIIVNKKDVLRRNM